MLEASSLHSPNADMAALAAQPRALLAVFGSHPEARAAAWELKHCGIDVTKLSIIGQECRGEACESGFYTSGERIRYWGFCPVMVPGALSSLVVSSVEGAVVVGGLVAVRVALLDLGLPRNVVTGYEAWLRDDAFLLVIQSDEREVEQARAILVTGRAVSAEVVA